MKKLLLLFMVVLCASAGQQMYIHIEGPSEGVCTATMKQLTLGCTGNAGHSDFILGVTRVGMADGKVIKNNTEGPIKTLTGWAYEIDMYIDAEWGDIIRQFVIDNPVQAADASYLTIAEIRALLPEVTIE